MKNNPGKTCIVIASLSVILGYSVVATSADGDKTKITPEAAKVIALKNIPGVILESEIDNEDSVLAYDFAIQKKDGSIFEIEINAYDGTVISIEEN